MWHGTFCTSPHFTFTFHTHIPHMHISSPLISNLPPTTPNHTTFQPPHQHTSSSKPYTMPPKKQPPTASITAAGEESTVRRWTPENEKKLLFLTLNRALTADDYARLVTAFPGPYSPAPSPRKLTTDDANRHDGQSPASQVFQAARRAARHVREAGVGH
jgi:hypothetical protein